MNYNSSKYSKFFVNFLLATSFAASFITFFFFTYAKDVEKTIVVDNVNYTIDNLVSTLLELVPNHLKELLRIKINNIDFDNMKEEDKKTDDANNKLLDFSIKIYGTLLVVCFISAFLIARFSNVNFEDILISNLILLVAIAITEYFFLNYIIAKFISVDPNKIKYAFVENL